MRRVIVVVVLAVTAVPGLTANGHPKLVLTRDGVEQIRAALGTVPLFDKSIARARAEVDAEIAAGIDIPVPTDYSGGYTHERHKRNFFAMQKAGVLYQILEDERYARYVRDILLQYAAMYRDLPLHPKTRSYARGKLFWQCLNDANWLVYASQAYDTIHDFLSPEERERLEQDLFRPFADHLSLANPRFFNRVHNHSTWGNAAVGMIGLVMDDDELVDRALYGLSPERFDVDPDARDDDGGFIFDRQGKAGFLANLDAPFSPDGYYTEGPYYQRYAMYPFLVFAQALHNTRPELGLFERRDGQLLKAVDALLQLSDADGEFFPLNDAQKGMSIYGREGVTAVNLAYLMGGADPQLLSIAAVQDTVLLDDAGIAVALGLRDGLAQPYHKRSINLSDGSDGSEGGVAVLRAAGEALTLVFKYSAQGLSHGHYDKLSFSLYERGDEVLQDYGMVRFVNIGQKGGGNYLPENSSWSKQSIAHNTLTLNRASHFGGAYDVGSQHHSELYLYDDTDPAVQLVSAKDRHAYSGTVLHRTMVMIAAADKRKPFVLDLLRVTSDQASDLDLPFYFLGQALETNFSVKVPNVLAPLGDRAGFQHLFVEGSGRPDGSSAQMTWFHARKFYTLTTASSAADTLHFLRIGANDPNFNLRREPGFLVRRNGVANTVFASAIEPHGQYSPVTEIAEQSRPSIVGIEVIHDSAQYTAVELQFRSGLRRVFVLAHVDASASAQHMLALDGGTLEWAGPFALRDWPSR
ncbi:MAG: heparinase II/III family protein [Pseudomonadota bacterium]